MAAAPLPIDRFVPAFFPNPAQLLFMNAVRAQPTRQRVDFYCKEAGIHRSTYYRWCHDTGFRQWFARSISEQMYMDGWILLNQAREKASQKFQYWKALFTLTFDPKGQEMMRAWQVGLAQPAAFAPPPPEPPAVASPTQSNQQLTPPGCDILAISAAAVPGPETASLQQMPAVTAEAPAHLPLIQNLEYDPLPQPPGELLSPILP